MARLWTALGAIVGGIVYAVTGVIWAASNLRWYGWTPDANPLRFDPAVWMGFGLALVVGGFTLQHGRDIQSRGMLGRWIVRFIIAATIILLLSPVIQFAIFGTLATFAALLMFTLLVYQDRLLPRLDVVLLSLATVASITWNTETSSAALLGIVGLVASWISYRALIAGKWRSSTGGSTSS